MKRSSARTLSVLSLTAVLALAFTVAGAQRAAAQEPAPEGSWTIGERAVPPPAGVSRQLNGVLTATPAPDVAAARQQAPQTAEQWLAMQKMSSNGDLEVTAASFAVSIEKDDDRGRGRLPCDAEQGRSGAHEGHLFLHVHGGAYVLSGGDASVTEAATGRRSQPASLRVSIDYRMPPEAPVSGRGRGRGQGLPAPAPEPVRQVDRDRRHLRGRRAVAGCPSIAFAHSAWRCPAPCTREHLGQT